MQEITAFMKAISDDAYKLVIQNFAMRVRKGILCQWQHIEHVIL